MTPAELATTVKAAAERVLADHDLDASVVPDTVTVERPRNPEHGDYATNIALQVAKKAGTNPRELAGWLAEVLAEDPAIAAAEIAGPGFINLRLAADAQGQLVAKVLEEGAAFGNSDIYAGEKVNLEFVSANPTGPIHLGGTRWAAVARSTASRVRWLLLPRGIQPRRMVTGAIIFARSLRRSSKSSPMLSKALMLKCRRPSALLAWR